MEANQAYDQDQHSISPSQRLRVIPNRWSTFLDHLGLVLHTQKRSVIVFDETAFELQRAAERVDAEGAELTHHESDAASTIVSHEVATALEESVEGVLWACDSWDGEVIVGGGHG